MNVTSPLLELPLMAVDRERVESALRSAVRTPDAYLTEIASHLIVAGGKRLRPVLAVAAAQVGNDGAVSGNVIQGAIA
ncbi:MAG: polyprenyl synthetase family protein, partial [Actinomycetota bacterium]